MLRIIGVLLSYLVAQIVPSVGVGWLVDAMDSPNEDARTMAYMALVKLGSKQTHRLLLLAKSGRQTARVLHVLGDVASVDLLEELRAFAESECEEVAIAAKQSIDSIRERSGVATSENWTEDQDN